MATLIIYRGDEDLKLPSLDQKTYLYRIGTGSVTGRECEEINDSSLLADVTIELRDKYTHWIYSLNNEFLDAGLIRRGLSLFFLSDLSNKRNELFDTFPTVANVTLINRKLENVVIDSMVLVGVDQSFSTAISSVFPHAMISRMRSKPVRTRFFRRFLADLKFFLEILAIIGLNMTRAKTLNEDNNQKHKYFFSFYPQTFNQENIDIRYGNLVESGDKFLVTITADGMHQQVPPWRYWKLAKTARKCKFVVIDESLRLLDLVQSFYWLYRWYFFLLQQRKRKYRFQNIDISKYVREETLWSGSRVARLVIFSNALQRVISTIRIKELVYIVFEYPLGRAISHVLGKHYPSIVRTGFNHGEFSWRFLNYFLAKGEASVSPPYSSRCPIPDRVLAEDDLSAEIYRYNGYEQVSLMPKVPRLGYLMSITPEKNPQLSLVAAGLHDGETLMRMMLPTIISNPDQKFILKPHPRARNKYVYLFDKISNLEISKQPIESMLSIVGRVYVTYSGVGVEAYKLGIPVTIVDIPGTISWSKLLDFLGSDNSGTLCRTGFTPTS